MAVEREGQKSSTAESAELRGAQKSFAEDAN
jgi:hypothetical protein